MAWFPLLKMFRKFGHSTVRNGSRISSNGIRSSHNFGGSRRSQSSFTFLNNHSLLQKDQVKQSKKKSRRSVFKADDEVERSQQKKMTVEISGRGRKQQRHDYSWLPRVPSTGNLKPRDMSMKVLYSGYRPLFINPDEIKTSSEGSGTGGTLYEFAMKLEELGDQSPWVTSATGLEYYREWDSIPGELQKKLKPFTAPEQAASDNVKNAEALKNLKEQLYLNEKAKILDRRKGRKKPVVSLLQLRKKLKQDG